MFWKGFTKARQMVGAGSPPFFSQGWIWVRILSFRHLAHRSSSSKNCSHPFGAWYPDQLQTVCRESWVWLPLVPSIGWQRSWRTVWVWEDSLMLACKLSLMASNYQFSYLWLLASRRKPTHNEHRRSSHCLTWSCREGERGNEASAALGI